MERLQSYFFARSATLRFMKLKVESYSSPQSHTPSFLQSLINFTVNHHPEAEEQNPGLGFKHRFKQKV